MTTIVYDLETTDLNPVGQIINFAFVAVDKNWNEISSVSGKIKLSRLQIPSPGALLANRTNILEHQEQAEYTEAEAMWKIREYLQEIIERNFGDPVIMFGYNSTRFDLPFLRTSMIRNGVNPYFGRNGVINRDLLHASQWLSRKNKEFAKLVPTGKSLGLATCTQALGILKGEQVHESRADVDITIALAKYYAEKFGKDIRYWDPYEPNSTSYDDRNTKVYRRFYPKYDGKHHKNPEEDDSPDSRMVLLEENATQALWIDLDKFEAGNKDKSSVFWYNKNTSAFYIEELSTKKEDIKLAEEAITTLQDITLANYFPDKNCDIEQFIYMMPFDEKDSLYEAIWMKDLTRLKRLQSKFGAELYLRFLLANEPVEGKLIDQFKKYVNYRYGGQLKLSKYAFDEKFQPGVYSENFHLTYNEYLNDIDSRLNSLKTSIHDMALSTTIRIGQDENILKSLKQYILESDITKFCGKELSQVNRIKNV